MDAAVGRYFIDLRNKGGMARDEEGMEFIHLKDAPTEAKDSARDLVQQFMDDRTRSVKPASNFGTRKAMWWPC